ncbi:MAG: hypothetical protein COX77_02015 [Candidatus Komeilibacteria bacterium CG_4_10_14_0_2_um_filter_37_10]|uniref:Segregation and condensation protein A n=1 Tax=Candidatus Komeilibacteria bacterium CG_4_10_14_0_2_um_filter_37_10 TaxID=1974470 RepID=A0A2M7VFB2_9BACT|nr:MAG: hypothetical protein COX77_02015 [Candidatus Komeilibacteria bacterium CG_4_10_14_0_2_um_filter_37_10]PJA94141.1 MAG: hypothetical protein CO133_00505 [Candidatus Komeilibacteria bacterium CG_4_9_14_3_um_filter_37_5]
MYQIKLEKFEGPLDLLLQLIEDQELPITEVALAQVTDQYVEYIHSAAAINPEEIADFLLIAAKLLYLKSKELLPLAVLEEDQDIADLEQQLKIYKEYHDASKLLEKMVKQEKFMYSRLLPFSHQLESGFYPPTNLPLQNMAEIFTQVLRRLEPIINIPRSIIEKTITVTEKINQIKNYIKQAITFDFRKLLKQGSRTDVIISFLAMLELVKQKDIEAEQNDLFGNITIKKIAQS